MIESYINQKNFAMQIPKKWAQGQPRTYNHDYENEFRLNEKNGSIG